MPVYRDENGKIVEQKPERFSSKKARPSGAAAPGVVAAAVNMGGDNPTVDLRQVSSDLPDVPGGKPVVADNAKTKKLTGKNPADLKPSKTGVNAGRNKTAASDDKTALVGRRSKKKTETASAEEPAPANDDPIVGWLVVTSGDGQGMAHNIGYGNNTVGRGADARICINYGDNKISRSAHCTITYDAVGRSFYLLPGTGNNLTYVDKKPVLGPSELPSRAQILMGDTLMEFVPFCGPDFDWQDLD